MPQSRRLLESLEARKLLSDSPTPVAPTVEPADVVGTVFRDANGDGTRQSTEGGQANVKVYLDYNGNGSRDGDAEPIVTTSSTGRYEFDNVTAGAPVDIRLLLAGTNFAQTWPINSAPRVVTPTAGKTVEAEQFGVHEQLPAVTTGTVTGIVFRDSNSDGTQQSTEKGQANIKVYLDFNGNGVRDGDAEPLTTTSSDGSYKFANVAPATAVDVRLLLAGTNFVQTRPGNNAPRAVNVVAGQTATAESFGVNEASAPVITTLSGLVYTDKNKNGQHDDGEAGRSGVKVYIDTNKDGSHEDGEPLMTTASNGTYQFANVSAGSTQLRLLLTGTNLQQTDPANNAPVLLTVVSGKATSAAAFGVAEILVTPPPPTTATVSGTVFYDTDSDTKRDNGEAGRANVRVYLDLNNDGKRDNDETTVVTASNGAYKFTNAPVSNELKVRLDLTNTNLKQTYPTNGWGHTIKTVAGKTYVDENFGVHEVAKTTTPVTTTPVTTTPKSAATFSSIAQSIFGDGDAILG